MPRMPQSAQNRVFRLDRGSVNQPYLTKDGILLCDAVFARDGVLEYDYIADDGTVQTRRELRLPEENKRALAGFGLTSVTIEHPDGLVDANNGDQLRHGISLQHPRYEIVEGKGGFVKGQIALLTTDARDAIASGISEISAGYECWLEESPGEWFNPGTGRAERYDGIQRDIDVNHVCLTRQGRAGADVRALADSLRFCAPEASPTQPKQPLQSPRPRCDAAYQSAPTVLPTAPQPVPHPTPQIMEQATTLTSTPMTTLHLPGGSIALPMEVYAVLAPLLQDREAMAKELDAMKSQQSAASTAELIQLEPVEDGDMVSQDEYDKMKDRADSLKARLDAADTLLLKAGFVRRGDAYVPRKGKRRDADQPLVEDMDDEEEMTADMEEGGEVITADMDEDMDDEMNDGASGDPRTDSRRGKGKAKQSKQDAIASQAAALFRAYKDAAVLCPDLDQSRFDSAKCDRDVHRMVVAEKFPDLKLDSKPPGFIEGIYQVIVETHKDSVQDSGEQLPESVRPLHDSQDYVGQLSAVTRNATHAERRGDSRNGSVSASAQKRMGNYNKPLTASKRR